MQTNKIVETNIYRCVEYCPNCPFLDDDKAIVLEEGRLDEIKKMLLENDNNSFSCHKTVYNLNNKMKSSAKQTSKMCYGAYTFLKNKINLI